MVTWVSDLNPLRTEQAKLFEKLHPNIIVNVDPILPDVYASKEALKRFRASIFTY